jgi:uncharacterized protein (TIGR02246 family)
MKRETTTHYQTDEAKILALFEDLLEDWGRGDGEAYGSHFTEDADYVAFDGTRTRGAERSLHHTSDSSTSSSRARASQATS